MTKVLYNEFDTSSNDYQTIISEGYLTATSRNTSNKNVEEYDEADETATSQNNGLVKIQFYNFIRWINKMQFI